MLKLRNAATPVLLFLCASPLASTAQTGSFPDNTHVAHIVQEQPRGPSFYCKLPDLSTTERTICADATLSLLDQKLNTNYATAGFESYHALTFAESQIEWLRARDRCVTVNCLRAAYRSRLAEVQAEAAGTNRRRKSEPNVEGRGVDLDASSALKRRIGIAAGLPCIGRVRLVDLGDGKQSYVASTCRFCSPNDGFVIVHPDADRLRVLARIPQCYVSLIFSGLQDERSHGLRRFVTFSRDDADQHSMDFFDYNGQSYVHVGSLLETYVNEQNDYLLEPVQTQSN